MAELFVHDFAAPVVTWLVILITGGICLIALLDLSHRSARHSVPQIISPFPKRSGCVMECNCISNLGTWAETDAHLDRVCSLRSARSALLSLVGRWPQKGY